jgi:hypothetical protein
LSMYIVPAVEAGQRSGLGLGLAAAKAAEAETR